MHVDHRAGGRGALSSRVLSAAALLCVVGAADASGIDQLRSFVSGAKSGKATFRQVVTSQRGTTETTGTFTFQRPGKFRWVYEKPYEQLIVGDGDKLWIYDRDLNQVIVRKLDAALGSSPAALLSGDNALERNFELADSGKADGAEWVDAKPKAADTGFERVRIGFRDNLPRVMELKDMFGNVTRLEFGTFERNATLDSGQFKFVPPKGADVVGEK